MIGAVVLVALKLRLTIVKIGKKRRELLDEEIREQVSAGVGLEFLLRSWMR